MKPFVRFRSKPSRRRQARLISPWYAALERLEDRTLPAALALDFRSIDSGERTALIINGAETSDYASVGKLIVTFADGPGFCTGTLIAPQYVLTAAHCAVDGDGILASSAEFTVGNTTYQAEEIFVHPEYGGKELLGTEAANDIAIIKLSEPVIGVTPVQIFRGTPHVGQLLTIVGFGHGGSDVIGEDDDFGTKRRGTTTIDQVSSKLVSWTFDEPSESNIANGDSGGPGFVSISGTLFVAGVTSAGDSNAALIGARSYDTRVDAFAAWIDSIVEDVDSALPTNAVPQFTKGPDQAVAVQAGFQTVANWATAISPGADDEAGQHLKFIVVSVDNPGLFSVQPTISENGTLTFTPSNSLGGVATVTVKLHDDGGTANGGVETSAPQTFKITTFVPDVTYTAHGNARVRAVVSNGVLVVLINGIRYSSYQPEFMRTLTINGGSSNDEINLSGLSNLNYPLVTSVKINGGAGNDKIVGSDLADSIDGGAGNDTLQAGLGDDTILGGSGNDGISGRAGSDSLLGGDGNDTVLGGIGDDKMFGGNGNDLLIGGDGADMLTGDAGRDTVCGGQGGPERGGTGMSNLGDIFASAEVISEAFKKLFTFE